MGKSQRNKGASYEREVCTEINAALGTDIKRHIGQARDGGHDALCGPLVLEMKRRKTLTTFRQWYEQAMRACARVIEAKVLDGDSSPSFPVIVCREDNGESFVLLSLQHFLKLTRPALTSARPDQLELL